MCLWSFYSFYVSNPRSHYSLYMRLETICDRYWKVPKYTFGPYCPLQNHTPPRQEQYSAEDVSLPLCSDQQLHKPLWKREQASTLQNKTPTDQSEFLKQKSKGYSRHKDNQAHTCSMWKWHLSGSPGSHRCTVCDSSLLPNYILYSLQWCGL